MFSAAQLKLIDKAATLRGVDEITFCREADERRRDAVSFAREVLAEAEEERTTTTKKVTRAPVTASAAPAPAPKKRSRVTQELFQKWGAEYKRCADSDIDGLDALAGDAFKHIEDPALLVYTISMLTIHRIKRERLEQRIARLEGSEFRASQERSAYQGIYEAGNTYEPGDIVTHGGTLWHCWERTTDRPGTKSWQLMVKTR